MTKPACKPISAPKPDPARLRGAWAGRICGCLLGKPLEVLSFRDGPEGVAGYLRRAHAWPLRDYVPAIDSTVVARLGEGSCRGQIRRAEPDDDINYTVLALVLLEKHGIEFDSADVARAWLNYLPAGSTWTAERAAYRTLLNCIDDEFVNGAPAGFDLDRCADNEFNEWIGAQIRADLYGWVCPGQPALAAELAARDASLSHRGEGIYGAVFVAALGAAIPAASSIESAMDVALEFVPSDSAVANAVRFARDVATAGNATERLQAKYGDLPPVHTVNNLAIVVWALCSARNDFSRAVGDAVGAGCDTDCNGATVGGLLGLAGVPIPDSWTRPWQGRIAVGLAGCGELALDDVVARTLAVAEAIAGESHGLH